MYTKISIGPVAGAAVGVGANLTGGGLGIRLIQSLETLRSASIRPINWIMVVLLLHAFGTYALVVELLAHFRLGEFYRRIPETRSHAGVGGGCGSARCRDYHPGLGSPPGGRSRDRDCTDFGG